MAIQKAKHFLTAVCITVESVGDVSNYCESLDVLDMGDDSVDSASHSPARKQEISIPDDISKYQNLLVPGSPPLADQTDNKTAPIISDTVQRLT